MPSLVFMVGEHHAIVVVGVAWPVLANPMEHPSLSCQVNNADEVADSPSLSCLLNNWGLGSGSVLLRGHSSFGLVRSSCNACLPGMAVEGIGIQCHTPILRRTLLRS
ncbi:hypothetical protein GGR57DRAFT_330907 [Xylariaceae sp. FL1272]|nr:hypothetical protein GGR57DRAFT_330907 [Xylariaceae sp. FL1272]